MRSPAVPRSAISLRSPVAIRRPSGLFPGGKVFQLPPPVVDANVPTSGAPGCTGWARTGVSTGWASAISGADWVAACGAGAGFFAGAGGGDVWAIGAGAGGAGAGVDFSATTIGVADAEGCGVGLPLANLPFGVGVAFAPVFPFLGWTCTIGGGVTALAASTRTS